ADRTRDKNRPMTIRAVRYTIEEALASTPPGGPSAPLGALLHARRVARQVHDRPIAIYLVTDGLENESVKLIRKLSPGTAEQLADRIDLIPDLSGAALIIAGIGRTAGRPLRTKYVEALMTFWERICTRTHAKPCLVVDQLSVPSQSTPGEEGER
ncbi:MAG: hypothetical protein ACRDHO_04610, partial [Actinomycetota bacterium]